MQYHTVVNRLNMIDDYIIESKVIVFIIRFNFFGCRLFNNKFSKCHQHSSSASIFSDCETSFSAYKGVEPDGVDGQSEMPFCETMDGILVLCNRGGLAGSD